MLVLQIAGEVLVFILLSLVVAVAVMYVVDVRQTHHAVRRNFPVIGRFRYLFEWLGEFFRQYFFAMDREELPFNRAERAWVYRAAKGVETTVPFGSTRDLRPTGTVLFANCAFPTQENDARESAPLLVGPGCRQPYEAKSFFNISAMSYGAISRPAVLALSRGAAKAGCWMNTGEGGLSPYHLEGGADLIFQIGTAKYGVRNLDGTLSDTRLAEIAALPQVKMFEIKLSQGAKPGKGGILPAAKVTEEVARIRLIDMGKDSLSPNRHAEIASNEDLLDMIDRVRQITGKPTGFKTVIGSLEWLEDLCEQIRTRGFESAPDFITIDSADGGTGAAPQTLIDYVGMPVRESLPLVVDTLTRYGLRDRIRVIASGKLITAGEVAWALCVGADFVQSARGFMFALGCIQALQCHRNTCPTGITTHDPDLQRGLDVTDKSERVYRYATSLRKEVGVIAHACGVPEPRGLERRHCRIVQNDGRSRALSDLYPEPEVMPEPGTRPPPAAAQW
jgi:glutamate synthase domain-containing protein 2